ncbi:hypothetical protein IFM89_030212 [Coptis chinensis]|uniref:TFIIE beta domain-containing protein n=1 Tax=Coptis chinensis TaxID=261450 RepID=A0A835LX24_9MAGN|nr:hypothetical protein IFM89_030212 [Coptis chinensis]
MVLEERLSKFHKQQQKCISTLTSIRARAGSSNAAQHRIEASATISDSVPARFSHAIKFSHDTARLQQINSIRKSPVGSQIKRVIALLLVERKAFTPEEINERCCVDVKANKSVFESLTNNIKVTYEGGHFSYKSMHDVKDKDQLLSLIQVFPDGIPVVELKDAYSTVKEDLEVSQKPFTRISLTLHLVYFPGPEGHWEVYLLNLDSQSGIVYPDDPKVQIAVDDDLMLLFQGIELPRDMIDIEKDLQKNGMRPATNTARRRAIGEVHGIASKPKPKPKKKKQGLSKRTKLTNAHLPELFQILNDMPEV